MRIYDVLYAEQLEVEFSQPPQLQTLGMGLSFRLKKKKSLTYVSL